MILKVNGSEVNLGVRNIPGLLKHYGIKKGSVVIEINGIIIKKEEYASFALKENDSIEIITIAGGG
ncbi:sulfur carrier protein ThiS [Candidatus Woesearchaeota archaeon]|nr:sulfur carrier protein ThiS [Candidatus Woesearchaeota archaeon]